MGRQARSAPAASRRGSELRLLRQDLVEVVLAEGVALDLEDFHGLATPLGERCRHAEQDAKRLDQRSFEVGAAVQDPALEFDALAVLVEAAAEGRWEWRARHRRGWAAGPGARSRREWLRG